MPEFSDEDRERMERDKSLYGFAAYEAVWACEDADPTIDLIAEAHSIYEQTGYAPQTTFLSSSQKKAYENFMVWFVEMERLLEIMPRRRFITRMVLRRMLQGPWHKRGRCMQAIRAWNYRRKLEGHE